MSNNGLATDSAAKGQAAIHSSLSFDWQAKLGPVLPEDFFELKSAMKSASVWPFFDLALDKPRRRIVGPKGTLEIVTLDGSFEALSVIIDAPYQTHSIDNIIPAKGSLLTATSAATHLNNLLKNVSVFTEHFLIPRVGSIQWNPSIRTKVLS